MEGTSYAAEYLTKKILCREAVDEVLTYGNPWIKSSPFVSHYQKWRAEEASYVLAHFQGADRNVIQGVIALFSIVELRALRDGSKRGRAEEEQIATGVAGCWFMKSV